MDNKKELLRAIGEIKDGFYHLLDAYEAIEDGQNKKLKDFLLGDFCELYPFERSIDEEFFNLVCFEEDIENRLKYLYREPVTKINYIEVDNFPTYMLNYCEYGDKNNISSEDITNYSDWIKENNLIYSHCDTDDVHYSSSVAFGLPCDVCKAYFLTAKK